MGPGEINNFAPCRCADVAVVGLCVVAYVVRLGNGIPRKCRIACHIPVVVVSSLQLLCVCSGVEWYLIVTSLYKRFPVRTRQHDGVPALLPLSRVMDYRMRAFFTMCLCVSPLLVLCRSIATCCAALARCVRSGANGDCSAVGQSSLNPKWRAQEGGRVRLGGSAA